MRSPETIEQATSSPQQELNKSPEINQTTVIDNANKNPQVIVDKISRQEAMINDTTNRVNEVRRSLSLPENTPIPSVDLCKQKIEQLENSETVLQQRLLEIINLDVSKKFESTINEAKLAKIGWAQSEELARRLKLKGAKDEDIEQIRTWLITNVNEAKVIVLKPSDFSNAVDYLKKLTGETNLEAGNAFYANGGIETIPDQVKNSLFLQEKPAPPPLPGTQQVTKENINETELNHELGHAAQDGLLSSELYQDWNPIFKQTATDPEYIGKIEETDTRICSMFREAKEFFNPQKEAFEQRHLELLRTMLKENKLSRDVTDLFNNYNDTEIIKYANELPAI